MAGRMRREMEPGWTGLEEVRLADVRRLCEIKMAVHLFETGRRREIGRGHQRRGRRDRRQVRCVVGGERRKRRKRLCRGRNGRVQVEKTQHLLDVLTRRIQCTIGNIVRKKKTDSVLLERDTIFSTIADGTNTSATRVGRKTHRTKHVLAGARIGCERIDGKGRPGLADVSISEADGREIERPWPGGIGRDCARSPNVGGSLPVRRRQRVKEGGQRGRLLSRVHDGSERAEREREIKERWGLENKGRRGRRRFYRTET
jgi:hypothetical protein